MNVPHRHELLSPVDAAWYRMDASDDPADVAAVLFFDGRIDEPRLRRTLEQRLLRYPRFRQRVVDRGRFRAPRWEDDDGFSLARHLRRRSLHPGDDLAKTVSKLVSRPMSFTHSPWTATLLSGADGNDALFVRLHHCLGDGFALLDVLVSLADADSEAPSPGAVRRAPPTRDDGGRGSLASLGHLLTLPFEPATLLRAPLSGTRRVAWTDAFELDDVKRAAWARGGTVNDLLLATLAGALRRYLLAHEGAAAPIRAIVPINLRPPGAPVAWTRGNWFGLVFLDLPVAAETHAERLAAIHERMDLLKRSREASVALGILGVMGRAPIAFDRLIEAVFSHKASVVVTNVAGPPQRLRLAGAPVRDIVFWVPHPCGLGLGVSILSYAGRLRVGFRADRYVVPDPDLLASLYAEELGVDLAAVRPGQGAS